MSSCLILNVVLSSHTKKPKIFTMQITWPTVLISLGLWDFLTHRTCSAKAEVVWAPYIQTKHKWCIFRKCLWIQGHPDFPGGRSASGTKSAWAEVTSLLFLPDHLGDTPRLHRLHSHWNYDSIKLGWGWGFGELKIPYWNVSQKFHGVYLGKSPHLILTWISLSMGHPTEVACKGMHGSPVLESH